MNKRKKGICDSINLVCELSTNRIRVHRGQKISVIKILLKPQDKSAIFKFIFLFLNQDICSWYSKNRLNETVLLGIKTYLTTDG